MNKMGNSKTVYRTILRPLLIVLLVEIVLMTGSYWLLGINGQLNKNARDILIQQTENRKSYLQNEMIQKWSNLSTISQTINERTQQLIDQDVISLQTLDSSSKASTPLLNEISKELISTLYSKETTGIFVILNTHDLRENKDNKPGIYIRNNDPSTFSVKEYGDLLLEKAPVEVVRSLNISTDTHWESTFDLSTEENTLLYKPFEKAYHDKIKMEAKEYGYWNEKSYHLKNNEDSAISYSMPLILPDGTVYGVVGVELLTSYLENLMPIDELKNDNQGSYVLSVEMNDQHNSLVVSSASVKRKQLKKFYLTEDNDKNNFVYLNGKEYYAAVQNLNIYNSNGPFSKHQWQLVSLVERNQLYTFSNHIFYLQISMIVLVGIVSLIGIFYVSRKISGPISRLSKDAASMILTDDNFSTIVKAVITGRNVYRNIKNSINYLLSGNFAGILCVFIASLLLLPTPFFPVHLLFMNLITDSLPAIAIGMETGKNGVLKEKPRSSSDSILNKQTVLQITFEGIIIAICTMCAYLFGLKQDPLVASTMAFATICLARLLHGFNCRSNLPLTKIGFYTNRSSIYAFLIGFSLLHVILFVPFMHSLFMIQTISITQLFVIYAFALIPTIIIQTKKYWSSVKINK